MIIEINDEIVNTDHFFKIGTTHSCNTNTAATFLIQTIKPGDYQTINVRVQHYGHDLSEVTDKDQFDRASKLNLDAAIMFREVLKMIWSGNTEGLNTKKPFNTQNRCEMPEESPTPFHKG